jgi:urea transporter
MRLRFTTLLPSILYGYGQLFLCRNNVSSVLFLLALVVSSPVNALWSLLGAIVVTTAALLFKPDLALLKSGLFSVNGVLLGYSWIFFPEVPNNIKLVVTILASILCALVLTLVSNFIRIKGSRITLFTIPYVAVTFLMLFLLPATGAYDRNLYQGWTSLSEKDLNKSSSSFQNVESKIPRVLSFREDGLGWNSFFQKNYPAARLHFQIAINQDTAFADAYDGLGWTSYKLGDRTIAQQSFSRATVLNPFLADSWDGLGWLYLEQGQYNQSKSMFTRGVLTAPLFADAWYGLHRSLLQLGKTAASARCLKIHQWLKGKVNPQYTFMSSGQLLAFVLLLCGFFIHSWVSGTVVIASIVFYSILQHFLPHTGGSNSLNMLYNLAALTIAIGGHYLRPSKLTWIWSVVLIFLFVIFWSPATNFLLKFGLPLLCLPFNLFLLGTLLLGYLLQKFTEQRLLVPLDVAITTPQKVHRWYLRAKTARKCWSEIASNIISISISKS